MKRLLLITQPQDCQTAGTRDAEYKHSQPGRFLLIKGSFRTGHSPDQLAASYELNETVREFKMTNLVPSQIPDTLD